MTQLPIILRSSHPFLLFDSRGPDSLWTLLCGENGPLKALNETRVRGCGERKRRGCRLESLGDILGGQFTPKFPQIFSGGRGAGSVTPLDGAKPAIAPRACLSFYLSGDRAHRFLCSIVSPISKPRKLTPRTLTPVLPVVDLHDTITTSNLHADIQHLQQKWYSHHHPGFPNYPLVRPFSPLTTLPKPLLTLFRES